jgi:hypothetical protein
VDSSKIALLNANYMAHRLSEHYSLRYKNANGRVAHELLMDLAEFDKLAGLKVTDFAKRLQVSGPNSPLNVIKLTWFRITGFTHQRSLGPSQRVCLLSRRNLSPWKRLTGEGGFSNFRDVSQWPMSNVVKVLRCYDKHSAGGGGGHNGKAAPG